MRYAMLNQQSDLIGDTKAFDGATLFLPKKITDTVSVLLASTRNTNIVHVAYTNLFIFLSCINNFALGTCTCNTYMWYMY